MVRRDPNACFVATVVSQQLDLKKEARADRFGLNDEKKRRLDRAKRFNLETPDVVRAHLPPLYIFHISWTKWSAPSKFSPAERLTRMCCLTSFLQFEEKRQKRMERFGVATKK